VNIEGMPTFIGKGLDQVAFVVEDLDDSQALFGDLFGVKNWTVWEDLGKIQDEKRYYGELEDFQFSCAYGMAGDTLVELCRHDSGRTVYKDWLDTRGPGLNHIGFRLQNNDEFERAADIWTSRGAAYAMGGQLQGAGRWAYFDTVERLGCFIEIYWNHPPFREAFDRMKRGEMVEFPAPLTLTELKALYGPDYEGV
jgi:catechol 2,3-dioxygenase-like lactoylglutathione lyase family enzyme